MKLGIGIGISRQFGASSEAPAEQVATPTYSGATTITISCATSGAAIYYTTNGTDPTEESTLYTDPIELAAGSTTTFKAIAIKAGMTASEIATSDTYVIAPAAPTALDADTIDVLSFNAKWSKSTGATGYKVYVSTVATCDGSYVSGYNPATTGDVANLSITVPNAGIPYYYRIVAFNAGGDSASSSIKTVAVWTPALLTGINTWYDAKSLDTITLTDSTRVSAWNCKINGESKQYTSTGDARPTLASGAVAFDGSTSFMERTHNLAGQSNASFFYIFKQAASPNATQIFMSHMGSSTMYNGLTSSATRMFGHNGTLVQTAESGMSAANLISAYHLFECNYIVNNAASRVVVYAHNGTDDISESRNMGNRTFNNSNKLILGNLASSWLKGSLLGIISIIGTISAGDLTKLRAFCQNYYGAA